MDTKDFEDKRWKNKVQTLEFRHRAAAPLAEGSVLDVGCGDGTLLGLLSGEGRTVFGTDISDTAIVVASAKGFVVKRMAGYTLPFEDGSFDTVVALDVLEHLYEPEPLLLEMKRVSRRFVIVGVPNFSSLPARLQVLLGRVPENNRPHLGHVYWFNQHVLSRFVTRAGLSVETMRTNTLWERFPMIGSLTRLLAALAPNLFALSFVVRLTKRV